MRNILVIIIALFTATSYAEGIRKIEVDSDQTKELPRFYNFCIGAGRANEGLRAEWQKHLQEIKNECGFRYIRFHGLLHDDMGVYKEKKGKPVYNFHY